MSPLPTSSTMSHLPTPINSLNYKTYPHSLFPVLHPSVPPTHQPTNPPTHPTPSNPSALSHHKPINRPVPPPTLPRNPYSPPPPPALPHYIPRRSPDSPATLCQSAWAGPAAAAPAAASAPPRTFANPVGIFAFAAEGVGSGGGTGAGANKKDCRHRLSDYDEECEDGIWSMGMRFWEGYHRRNHACC